MLAYQYDSKTKKYKGEITRQLDPLMSKKLGKEVYLMPADSTNIPPLEEKEDFDIIWNGKEWEYKEQEKEKELEPYIPTEKEKLEQELWQLKNELQQSDYKALKFAEGWLTEEEYFETKTERQVLRQKINEIQEKIDNIEE